MERIKAIALFFDNLNEKEKMVANNAFLLKEMKEQAKTNGIKLGEERGVILSKREDILDMLSEIATVTEDIIKLVNEQSNIEILKKWLKTSARVSSLDEFKEKI